MVAKPIFVNPGRVPLRLRPERDRWAEPRTGLRFDRSAWLWPSAVGVLVVAWAMATVLAEPLRLITLAPRPQVAVEATSALCLLFGALVLVLFPHGSDRCRLGWVGSGLAVMGVGSLAFGNFWPMWAQTVEANATMYASWVVWTSATTMLAIGLLPRSVPRLSPRVAVLAMATTGAVAAAGLVAYDRLPELANVRSLAAASLSSRAPMAGLSAWHWSLAMVPLILGAGAAVGAVRHGRGEAWQGWLTGALVLLAGSLLHHALWPSAYSTVLTSAGLLRLASGAVVAVGGILELRRLAGERALLLAAERERAQALSDLATVKSDFTAMVAHELDPTVAAIRAWADVLASERSRPDQRDRAVTTIRAQALRLQALAADVRAIGTVECDDFTVHPTRVAIDDLIAVSTGHCGGLPGRHLLQTSVHARDRVWADPERIGQVLRNLLDNAMKFSPTGTPVEVVANRIGPAIRIEVVDRGPGVAGGDEQRIFEKYVQGRTKGAGGASGAGLGLYLSKRIVQAHGGELTVRPTPGGGATFWFDLRVVD